MLIREFQDTLRPTITGTRGMVTSAHPLATGAGLRILAAGGNAFDAAVAVAAVLNVVEPYMSGMGGIGYAIVYSAQDNRISVLDYVGRTAHNATLDAFSSVDDKDFGIKSCLVPGACGGWLALLERYGTMSREQVFAPAIELADGGYAITARNEFFIAGSVDRLNATAKPGFLFEGQPLRQGMILKQPRLADAFRAIVARGADVFYRGELASAMAAHSQRHGGLLTERDLSEFEPQWVEPVSIKYRESRVYCPPPPCSGIQILQTLGLMEAYPVVELAKTDPVRYFHLLIEAIKLASADRAAYAAADDPPTDLILSEEYIAHRRRLIGETAAIHEGDRFASEPWPGMLRAGSINDWKTECTTHFDAIDAQGNAIAITQSLGGAFGSGVEPAEAGFLLNNFLYWADLDPASPNRVAPNRKMEMCLSPCQIWNGDRLSAVLGTPGGYGIPQTTPQVMMYLEMGLNIQAAIEAPRLRVSDPGRTVPVEGRLPDEIRAGLATLGHEIEVLPDYTAAVGGVQGIVVNPSNGAFTGGADPRRDGYALGF